MNEEKEVVIWHKRLGIYSVVFQPILAVILFFIFTVIFAFGIAGGGDGVGMDSDVSNIYSLILLVTFLIWFALYAIGVKYVIKNVHSRNIAWYFLLLFSFLGILPILLAGYFLVSFIQFSGSTKNTSYDFTHKSNARAIEVNLESYYAQNQTYCGEFKCGEYSFKSLMEKLGTKVEKESKYCKNPDRLGGGTGKITEQGYELIVYDTDCVNQINKIGVGDIAKSTKGISSKEAKEILERQGVSFELPEDYKKIVNLTPTANDSDLFWYKKLEFNPLTIELSKSEAEVIYFMVYNTTDAKMLCATGGWESCAQVASETVRNNEVLVFKIDNKQYMKVVIKNNKSYVFGYPGVDNVEVINEMIKTLIFSEN